ncbi:MAG: ACT domain-containing protein [Firmicutes bacterium]|jgi:ACT domain-containing protein|nr:ACT domain-containing protein [Bacillota bacterium]
MKAVVTVIGKDMVGILAKVASACADKNANVLEVTQSILEGYFCMVMVIDISKLSCQLDVLEESLKTSVPDMVIHVMHEDIFNSMHRI